MEFASGEKKNIQVDCSGSVQAVENIYTKK